MGFLDTVSNYSIHSKYTLAYWHYDKGVSLDFLGKLSLIIIENGCGRAILDGKSITLHSPMILCLHEQEQFVVTSSENLKGRLFSFYPNLLNTSFDFQNTRQFNHSFNYNDIAEAVKLAVFFTRSNQYTGCFPASEPVLKKLNKMLDLLDSCSEPDIFHQIFIELLDYLNNIIKSNYSLNSSIINNASFEVQDILQYLHNNYQEKITIPDLSKMFHVNRTTLSDRFFSATGETIITYLNKYRINIAAFKLRDSKSSISEIAADVGFNDTAYFAKLFKKYMNHTPSEYRERYDQLLKMSSN